MKIRESNFELLRILCMWGVLTNHVLQGLWELHTPHFTFANELRILLMSISIVAVNCFVLISGYFRIKASWKGLVKLYLQCAFYMALFAAGCLSVGQTPVEVFTRILFPLTAGGLWFLTAYFGLFLISPLLNAGYDGLSPAMRKVMVLLLLAIDVYIGYMHQCVEATIDGYHLIHFIVIYYLGMSLREMPINLSNVKIRGGYLALLLIAVALHAAKMVFPPTAIVFSFRYNSPVVLLLSVFAFEWVRRLQLKSKWINWVSVSVLSVYIIHSNPFVGHYFFGWLKHLRDTYNGITAALLIPAVMLLLYGGCILLDKVRIAVCTPLEHGLLSVIEKAQARCLSVWQRRSA